MRSSINADLGREESAMFVISLADNSNCFFANHHVPMPPSIGQDTVINLSVPRIILEDHLCTSEDSSAKTDHSPTLAAGDHSK